MSIFKQFIAKLADLKTITLCLVILNILSVMAIYSSLHQNGEFTDKEILVKQIIWIGIGWLSLIVFSRINYRLYFGIGYFLYILSIILLIIVDIFGKSAMGAQRWISIFGITFQPSELSKIAIIILLARFFQRTGERQFIRNFLIPLILVVINALVIFLQPDLGTALFIMAIFILMGFFSNIKKRYFISLLIIILIASPFAINSLKDYQKKRLLVFLNPNIDPLGSGYTIIQSKIAIGSGRLLGKGFLAGTQNQFNFLPERHTDFIFTVIAEEWGLLGSLFLIFIYWLIIMKVLQRARTLRDPFAYFLCLGASIFLFLHVCINIGMAMGILPIVGLPLILLSYGGTNLLATFMLMGIFFNICKQ